MAAAKLARWRCPNCGAGILAPRRARRDDVRRYCLACSAETGRLVERVAPALEAERKRKAEASADRRRAKAERRAEAWTIRTVDALGRERPMHVEREVKRVAKLMGHRHVEVTLQRRRVMRGFCYPWRIHISAPDGCATEDLQELIAHEVAHLVAPTPRRRGRRVMHGREFRDALAKVVGRAYRGCGRIPAAIGGRRQESIIRERLRERTRKLASE